MTKRLLGEQIQRRAAARRSGALARVELRTLGVPRETADGPMSPAIKARDPVVGAAIEAFLAKKEKQP